ncbi:hypothetical protein ACWC3X_09685 [Streptomyces populi]
MIVPDAAAEGRASRRLGFARFTTLLEEDRRFREWFAPLERSIAESAQHPEAGTSRLELLESVLSELIDLLGPDMARLSGCLDRGSGEPARLR